MEINWKNKTKLIKNNRKSTADKYNSFGCRASDDDSRNGNRENPLAEALDGGYVRKSEKS